MHAVVVAVVKSKENLATHLVMLVETAAVVEICSLARAFDLFHFERALYSVMNLSHLAVRRGSRRRGRRRGTRAFSTVALAFFWPRAIALFLFLLGVDFADLFVQLFQFTLVTTVAQATLAECAEDYA